jgi:hypothetical protein
LERREIGLMMNDKLLYEESITSNRTEVLFIFLTLLSSFYYIGRVKAGKRDILATISLFITILFLFYSLNFRTLIIRLTSKFLTLKFGLFSWAVRLDNIVDCYLDEIPWLMRNGGAGIHFMMIRNRYRASFNFLEYPRLVIAFKKKVGPVQDISFSTRQPDQVIYLVQEAVALNQAV